MWSFHPSILPAIGAEGICCKNVSCCLLPDARPSTTAITRTDNMMMWQSDYHDVVTVLGVNIYRQVVGNLCDILIKFSVNQAFCQIRYSKQDCSPVGCIPPACWPYLPVCTARGRVPGPGCVSALGVPGLGPGLVLGGGGCLVGGGAWSHGGVVSHHTLRQTPHGQNSWHTLLKILPCPKLRLRAVKSVYHRRLVCTWDTKSQIPSFQYCL